MFFIFIQTENIEMNLKLYLEYEYCCVYFVVKNVNYFSVTQIPLTNKSLSIYYFSKETEGEHFSLNILQSEMYSFSL